MKKLLVLLALICSIVAAPVVFTGCGTTQRTTEAVVHDSFRTTYNAAKQAYLSWSELVVQNKVSKENEAKGDKAWNEFRAAFAVSFRAASNNWDAASPEQAKVLAAQFIALIRKL